MSTLFWAIFGLFFVGGFSPIFRLDSTSYAKYAENARLTARFGGTAAKKPRFFVK